MSCHTVTVQGVDVLTTDKDGGYRNYTGTSIAAPFVAGAIATHISAHHSADPDKLKAWLHTRCVYTTQTYALHDLLCACVCMRVTYPPLPT